MKLICNNAMPKMCGLFVKVVTLGADLRSYVFCKLMLISSKKIPCLPCLWALTLHVSEASPFGSSATASECAVHCSMGELSGSPPEVESRIWPNPSGSLGRSQPAKCLVSLAFGTPGTSLCVGKPRGCAEKFRDGPRVKIFVRCRCLSWSFFFKERSSSSRRPERHANTKEVEISRL